MQEHEHIIKTLEVMMANISQEEKSVSDKKKAVNELCRIAGRPIAFPDLDLAPSSGLSTRPDEYYGRIMPEVISAILEKRKLANQGSATVSEIYDAMKQGGFHFQTDNHLHAKRGIYSILSDSTFHKLPDGRYGLAIWYPAAKTKVEETAKQQAKRRVGRPRVKLIMRRRMRAPKNREPIATPLLEMAKISSKKESNYTTVLNYVKEHPNCRPSEVVAALLPTFESTSSNKPNLLHSFIYKLIKRGKLKKTVEGGIIQLEVA